MRAGGARPSRAAGGAHCPSGLDVILAELGPDAWISDLAKQGSGWAIAAILALVVGYMWREQIRSIKAHAAELAALEKARQDERVQAVERVTTAWKEVGDLMRESNVVQTQLTAARETGAAASNAIADATRAQSGVLARMIESVDRWVEESGKLRDVILQSGKTQ